MRSVLFALLALTLTGCSAPSFLITPVANTNTLQEVQVEPAKGWFAPKIAMIELEGMLANARAGGLFQTQENKLSLFTQQLEQAKNDPKVKAVVLRINSPGGTVTCSDTMYTMLRDFRAKTGKPVVASAQEVMASGAFYVACGSDVIVAQPTSVVGSIGVIFSLFEAEEGLAKLGIYERNVKSGPLKDMGSPFKAITPQEMAVMQGMIDEYYKRFLGVVQSHCKVPDTATFAQATDGRVFSGEQAQKIGLVDQVGELPDAIRLAKQMAKISDAQVVMYKRPYGYSGSIYADTSTPTPQANVIQLPLPDSAFRPKGFYYLWER
jgi:protease-4